MNGLFQKLGWFLGLVLLQVLVLNQMHIGGYATPFLYIYFLLKYDSKAGRNELMAWAFALGLSVDIFSNTPGMNAAAATCLAFFRTSLLRLVTLRDTDDAFRPGMDTLGASVFFRYVLLTCTLFCTLLVLVDTFSFFNFPRLLLKIISSIFATIICIFSAELIGKRKS